jgi:hypothetical protein
MTIFYCGRRETAVDWEVKIADFVPSTAKPASLRFWLPVFALGFDSASDATWVLLGKDAKKVPDAANRAKSLWETGLWRQKYRTPLLLKMRFGGVAERSIEQTPDFGIE